MNSELDEQKALSRYRIRRWSEAVITAACVAGAVTLLVNGSEHGWGWLLVLAFLAAL